MTKEPPKRMTFGELKAELDKFTPAQLAAPVVWSGEERGGYVERLWVAAEDWVGEVGDHETFVPRSRVGIDVSSDDYKDAEVCIPAGTPHLMVD